MIAMAERAGSVPWHFEDDATGMPVRVDQRPQFWAEERGTQAERGYDTIPEAYFAGADGGWTLDSAHKPLVSYTAYMVTGDAYYARELAHEAAFAIANIWPDLRDGRPLVIDAIQVRSRAWALRDIANAAWLLPEEAPLKGYFSRAREANINRLFESYVVNGRMDAAGETEGWFAEAPDGGVVPFVLGDDFLARCPKWRDRAAAAGSGWQRCSMGRSISAPAPSPPRPSAASSASMAPLPPRPRSASG